MKCAHVKNEVQYVAMKHVFVIDQLQFSFVSENKKNLIQFTSIFLLLNKGRSLIDYKNFKYLFDFFEVEKEPKKTLE